MFPSDAIRHGLLVEIPIVGVTREPVSSFSLCQDGDWEGGGRDGWRQMNK